MIAKIKALAKEYNDEVIQIRRHIHQHPELSFKEFETSKFIQKQLTSWGVEFDTGYVNTGIIAFVKGKNPSSKVIATMFSGIDWRFNFQVMSVIV